MASSRDQLGDACTACCEHHTDRVCQPDRETTTQAHASGSVHALESAVRCYQCPRPTCTAECQPTQSWRYRPMRPKKAPQPMQQRVNHARTRKCSATHTSVHSMRACRVTRISNTATLAAMLVEAVQVASRGRDALCSNSCCLHNSSWPTLIAPEASMQTLRNGLRIPPNVVLHLSQTQAHRHTPPHTHLGCVRAQVLHRLRCHHHCTVRRNVASPR